MKRALIMNLIKNLAGDSLFKSQSSGGLGRAEYAAITL
jgi:hypothetical protein